MRKNAAKMRTRITPNTDTFYTVYFSLYILILTSILVVLHLWSHSNFLLSILLLSGDAEMNPGPSLFLRKAFQSVTRILIALLPITIPLLKAYIAVYKFDIICLSEVYLDLLKLYLMIII